LREPETGVGKKGHVGQKGSSYKQGKKKWTTDSVVKMKNCQHTKAVKATPRIIRIFSHERRGHKFRGNREERPRGAYA